MNIIACIRIMFSTIFLVLLSLSKFHNYGAMKEQEF